MSESERTESDAKVRAAVDDRAYMAIATDLENGWQADIALDALTKRGLMVVDAKALNWPPSQISEREKVARKLHEAHKPFCDYTYPFEHPMSNKEVYYALADAVLADHSLAD